jgi:DNA-binding transcriptional MerR regulator
MTINVPLLVDTCAAAAAVGRPESTIRRWAHEERYKPHGRDKRGRKLYALADVQRVAQDLVEHQRGSSVVRVRRFKDRPLW